MEVNNFSNELAQFESMSKSYKNTQNSINSDNYDSTTNFQTFAKCLFVIVKRAVKSWLITKPLEFSHP